MFQKKIKQLPRPVVKYISMCINIYKNGTESLKNDIVGFIDIISLGWRLLVRNTFLFDHRSWRRSKNFIHFHHRYPRSYPGDSYKSWEQETFDFQAKRMEPFSLSQMEKELKLKHDVTTTNRQPLFQLGSCQPLNSTIPPGWGRHRACAGQRKYTESELIGGGGNTI